MKVKALAIAGLFLAASAHAQTQPSPDPTAPVPDAPAAEDPAAAPVEEPAPEPPPPPPPTTATVHVVVENVESGSGTVWVALCDTDLTIEGCPYKTSAPAAAGFVDVTFEDIPPGDYAVVGFHDVNDNGEFDMLLKVPREPYALSGAAGDMLVPRLKDALLPLAVGPNDVIIRMKRLGG